MLRSFVILGLATGLAMAADAKDPEVKAALAKVHAEAVRTGDVWTALQCESYGVRIGVRLSPILSASEVFGEPLFAFPAELRMVKDADSRLLVATSRTLHTLAPDGRPLTGTTRFPYEAESATFSTDGNVLAIARGIMPRATLSQAMITVFDTATGQERWKAAILPLAERPGQRFVMLQSAVSCDGSTVAGAVGHSFYTASNVIIANANGTVEMLLGFRQVRAVGPKGAWLLADQVHRSTPDEEASVGAVPVLRLGTTIIPFTTHSLPAVARDHVAVLLSPTQAFKAGFSAKAAEADGDAPLLPALVTPEGRYKALAFSLGLGPSSRLQTIGDFLVVNSGSGALPPPEIDILGMEVKPTGRQPPTFAVYSWEAVIRNPAQTIALFSGPGDAVACPTLGTAFYCCRGNELRQVDLSQNPPEEKVLGTFGQRLLTVLPTNNRLRLTTDTSYIVTDLDGQTLWSGKLGSEPTLNGPNWMTVGEGPAEGRSFAVVNLGAPADRRQPMPLAPRPSQRSARVDPFGRFVSIRDADDTRTVVSTADGRPVKPPLDARAYRLREFWDYPGRFGQYGSRLYDKRLPWPDGTKGEWLIRDGLTIGGIVLVLDDLAQLWMGRRGGPFAAIGTCIGANSLLITDRDKDVLVLNDDGLVVGRVATGGKLSIQPPLPLALTQTETRGAWQIDLDTRSFIPPRVGTTCRWNDHCGITPLALHSVNGPSQLSVATPSLVLGLDNAQTTLRHCAQPSR